MIENYIVADADKDVTIVSTKGLYTDKYVSELQITTADKNSKKILQYVMPLTDEVVVDTLIFRFLLTELNGKLYLQINQAVAAVTP